VGAQGVTGVAQGCEGADGLVTSHVEIPLLVFPLEDSIRLRHSSLLDLIGIALPDINPIVPLGLRAVIGSY
jgi:hypothetical protein